MGIGKIHLKYGLLWRHFQVLPKKEVHGPLKKNHGLDTEKDISVPMIKIGLNRMLLEKKFDCIVP